MSIIDNQNAKQLREQMQVFVVLSAQTSGVLSFTKPTTAKVMSRETLQSSKELCSLADFADEGFRLDSGCQLYDSSMLDDFSEDETIGIRSNIGEGMKLVVTSTSPIGALTLSGVSGDGTVSNGVDTYELHETIVISGRDKTSITLTFANSDENGRIEIAGINPGISLSFDNNNLISCQLGLRSSTSLTEPNWQVSDIEIVAYWPDSIESAISSVGDNVPILYTAGYAGDMSETRRFYLSEQVEQQGNQLTIKGEDASSRLDDVNLYATLALVEKRKSKQYIYNKLCSAVSRAGIHVTKKHKQSPPIRVGTSKETTPILFKEQTTRDIVANIMYYGHSNLRENSGYWSNILDFWPTFVDAGIPTLYYSKPNGKNNNGRDYWDIYEEDCGDVSRETARNIRRLVSGETGYGVLTSCSIASKYTDIETYDCITNLKYKKTLSDFYSKIYVTNAKITMRYPNAIAFTAKSFKVKKTVKLKNKKKKVVTVIEKKGKCVARGKKVSVSTTSNTLTKNRPGVSLAINPNSYGRILCGDESPQIIYPRLSTLLTTSNITGSFTWKGDPRMQPRDIFNFHRLDGTIEQCTIEEITLVHSGGGTSSTITYRKGVC